MLEASVEMIFNSHTHDMLEMGVVDMGIHSKQSFENDLDNRLEIFWERNA
jgi:hypothetical protein